MPDYTSEHSGGQIDAGVKETSNLSVADITALKNLSPAVAQLVLVENGATYLWVDGDTQAADNNVVIIESAVVGYTPGDTDEGRWVAQVVGGVYDIEWFGEPTGVEVTDSATWQNAVDSVPSGSTLRLNSEGYVISDIEMSASQGNKKSIVIDGQNHTVLSGTTTVSGDLISRRVFYWVGTLSAEISGLTIRDLTIDGQMGQSTAVVIPNFEERCIHLEYTDNVFLEHVTVKNWRSGFATPSDNLNPCPFQLLYVTNAQLNNCGAEWIGGECIDIRYSNRVIVDNFRAEDIGYGCLIIRFSNDVAVRNFLSQRTGKEDNNVSLGTIAGKRVLIENSYFFDHGNDFSAGVGNAGYGGVGFSFHSTTEAFDYEDVRFIGNRWRKMRNAIFIDTLSLLPNVRVRRIEFLNNQLEDMYIGIWGFRNIYGSHISGNHFWNMGTGLSGICDEPSILGTFEDLSSETRHEFLRDIWVTHNSFRDCSGGAIQLQHDSTANPSGFFDGIHVLGNHAVDCQGNVFWLQNVRKGTCSHNRSDSSLTPARHFFLVSRRTATGDSFVIYGNTFGGTSGTQDFTFSGGVDASRQVGWQPGYGTLKLPVGTAGERWRTGPTSDPDDPTDGNDSRASLIHFGGRYLWVDSTNNLRFKRTGATPTSDTDGETILATNLHAEQGAIVSLTNSTGGTGNDTLVAVSGSGADATINDNFSDLSDKIEEILVALRGFNVIST